MEWIVELSWHTWSINHKSNVSGRYFWMQSSSVFMNDTKILINTSEICYKIPHLGDWRCFFTIYENVRLEMLDFIVLPVKLICTLVVYATNCNIVHYIVYLSFNMTFAIPHIVFALKCWNIWNHMVQKCICSSVCSIVVASAVSISTASISISHNGASWQQMHLKPWLIIYRELSVTPRVLKLNLLIIKWENLLLRQFSRAKKKCILHTIHRARNKILKWLPEPAVTKKIPCFVLQSNSFNINNFIARCRAWTVKEK